VGLSGNPLGFLDAGLRGFVAQARNAVYLSPLLNGVPTLQALGWMDVETPYDAKTTQNLALMVLADAARKK
jgi:hypothetical protein